MSIRETFLTNELNQKMIDYRRTKKQSIKIAKNKGYVYTDE